MKITSSKRRVELQGCFNFRDLGGYHAGDEQTVEWGRLYRSDSVHNLTASDARKVRREIGIVTVIDLRSAREKYQHGTGLLALPPVHYHHLPLLKWQGRAADWQHWCPSLDMSECYLTMLEEAGETIARVVKLLTAPEAYPAVFHCMAGKDRTGVLAAALLSLLGVGDEEIIYDYALTEQYPDPLSDRVRMAGSSHTPEHCPPPEILRAAPETMERFLAKVREKYSSMGGFAMAHGVATDDLLRLRENLMSPAVVAVGRG